MRKLILLLILCVSIKIFGEDHQALEAGVYSTHWHGVYESKSEDNDAMELRDRVGDRVYLAKKPTIAYIGIRDITNSEKSVNIPQEARSSDPNEGKKSDRVKLDKVYLAEDNGKRIEVQPYAKLYWRYNDYKKKYLLVADVWAVVRGTDVFDSLSKDELTKLPNYLPPSGSVVEDNVSFSSNVPKPGEIEAHNLYLKAVDPDSGETYDCDIDLIVKVSVTITDIPDLVILDEPESDLKLKIGSGVAGETIGWGTNKTYGYKGAFLKVRGAAHTLVHTEHPDQVTIYKDGDTASPDQLTVDLKFDRNTEGLEHFDDEGELFLSDNKRLEDVNNDNDTSIDYWTADTVYYIDGECKIPDDQVAGNYSGEFTVIVKYEQ